MPEAPRHGPPTAAPSAAGRPRKWVGRCGECQAWGSVAEVGARRPARTAAGPVDHARRVPIGEVVGRRSRRPAPAGCPSSTGCSAAGWCPAPRSCSPASPGVGKSHAAARGRRPDRARTSGAPSTSPARSRPPRCGCAPTAPAASHDELLPRRRDRPRRGARPHRAGPARRCWSSTRCRPSAPPSVDGVARRRHPGQGGRRRADPGRQDRATSPPCSSATSPRTARSPGPRVLEHLVDVVLPLRGRPQLPAPDGARDEEPLRPDRRGRLLRPGRRRASPRSPTRPAVRRAPPQPVAGHLRHGHHGGPPPAARRGAGAGHRPRRSSGRAARRPGSTPPGSRWCSPCSSSTAGVRARTTSDVFVSTVGGARLHRAGQPTSPSPSPSARRHLGRRRRRAAWSRSGEIGLAGELRRVRDLPQRLAEAARLGFRVAVVPEPTPERARAPLAAESRTVDGMRVVERARRRLPPCALLRRGRTRPRPVDRSVRPGRAPPRLHADGARRRPRLSPREDVAVATERSDEQLRLRATLATIAPGTAAARRPRADPARPHRRADRARPRQDRRVDLPPAASSSTCRSPPPACASWPRWTARSSSTRDITRILARGRPPDARPHDPVRGDRHPAPHRRPGRQADRLPGHLGVAVDADHRGVRRRDPPRARGLRPDPVPRQPGAGDARALQAAPRRGLQHAVRAGDRGPGHGPRRRRRRPAARDGQPDRRARSRTTCSSSAPTAGCSRSSSRS